MSGCDFAGIQSVWHDVNTGYYELAHDIQDGAFKISQREVVVILLGRADIRRGRAFPAMVEKLLNAIHKKGHLTQFVLTGPFPGPGDGDRTLVKMNSARRYLEDRLTAEINVHFCRVVEHFMDYGGIRRDLITDEGLSPPRCRIGSPRHP